MEQSDCKIQYINHKETGFFSSLIEDYINNDEKIQPFINYAPSDAGMQEAIANRKHFPINRRLLVDVLHEQYKDYEICDQVKSNIESLLLDTTFTICSAHQPNILTGYAYFIYKIMHTIVLSNHLKQQFPSYNFVPVFYIGSEDDDLDELGMVRYNGKKFVWNTQQTGAVGSMQTKDLLPLVQAFISLLGPPSAKTEYITAVLQNAYTKYNTISAAIMYIINELMGAYGIVVLDPNNKQLKASFSDIIHKEIIQPVAYKLVEETNSKLNQHYKSQAFVRPINFFYLDQQQRKRIEQKDANTWKVVDTNIQWDQQTLVSLIETNPERFSPNVILRPLYQETILPNVAFIGGGSEIAYWMQLKSVFEHYQVFFPALIVRQSIQFQNKNSQQLQDKLGYQLSDIFKPISTLIDEYIVANHDSEITTGHAFQKIIDDLQQIKSTVITSLDKNLEKSIEAATTKMAKQIDVIEKKTKRAIKKKAHIAIQRMEQLKAVTFPNNSLMERYETFIPDYLNYDIAYFDLLLQTILPYGNQFLFITPKN